MITKQTDEEKKLTKVYRDKWIKIGRSTKGYDRKYIESVVESIYSKINLDKPKIYHFESPLSMIYGIQIFKNLIEKKLDLNEQNIKRELNNLTEVNYSLDFCYGSSDAHWLSFYDYFYEVFHMENLKKIENLKKMSQVNWWVPYEKYCFISRNPITLNFNEENLLHCEDGPAIEFKDGFKIYSINSVIVPEIVVLNPKKQTISEILKEFNIEVKRIRIERYGWSNFLNEIKAKPIDSAFNTNPGASNWLETLYDVQEFLNCNLLVTCDPSTGRVYFLEVDSSCENCEEAQRYLLSPDIIFNNFQDFKVPELTPYPKLRT